MGRQSSERVVIVGGGIQGCAAAYFLARAGWSVTVLEKDNIGRHASGANAGGVRRLGRDLREVPLSLAAMDIWKDLPAYIGEEAAAAFHPSFYMKVAIDDKGHGLGLDRIRMLENAGYQHEIWLSKRELKKRLPQLEGPLLGGVLVEGDGWAVPWRIVRGFAKAALDHGAEILEGCQVVQFSRHSSGVWKIETATGSLESDWVVNCAGAWAARLARKAGDLDFPLSAHAPMLAITERRAPVLPAVLGVLGHTLSLKQLDTGQFLIGGGVRATADLETDKAGLKIPEMATSIRLACQLLPGISVAGILRCWSGIEGYMPDDLPVIGMGGLPGLVHGFGFSAHGFQLGPGVGEVLADLVIARQTKVSLKPFCPSRFG
ncbi:NAD(P)/FAD-dependent oxidoreductase [Alphaproteobacteria bacterium LSUCC0684]